MSVAEKARARREVYQRWLRKRWCQLNPRARLRRRVMMWQAGHHQPWYNASAGDVLSSTSVRDSGYGSSISDLASGSRWGAHFVMLGGG